MSLPPNRKLFEELKGACKVMVETGSYRGDAIQQAVDAGFECIHSIDIELDNLKFCESRFNLLYDPIAAKRIRLHHGDSALILNEIIDVYETPILFWLDSHSQLLEGEPEYPNPFPLLAELEIIAAHPIKTHTIIIDDILHLTHPDVTGWSRRDIEDALSKINPSYKFEYLANPVKNNLLVVTP